MGHVVEAFRFLSARVATLEARLAAQDRPVEGPAWLVPARELGPWAGPVTAHVTATTPGGDIVHADCGEGSLLDAFASRGTTAHGVEPRGALALRALERGCTVTIAEASEYLRAQADADLGGIVLSGVVDRLALHDLLPLLSRVPAHARPGAPLIVLSEPVTAAGSREAPGQRPRRGSIAARSDVGTPARPHRVRRRRPASGGRGGESADRPGGQHAPVSGIHHFVPVLHRGDAVGRHTLRLRDATRARGFDAHLRRHHRGRDRGRDSPCAVVR